MEYEEAFQETHLKMNPTKHSTTNKEDSKFQAKDAAESMQE